MVSALKSTESGERIILTKGEMRLLLKTEAKRYIKYIFNLLLNEQLIGYYPAIKASYDCKNNIKIIFRHQDISNAIIEYFRNRETTGVLRPEKINLELRESLSDTLKQRVHELGRAPLMADFPEDTALELWLHFGSWSGALKFAGVAPLAAKNIDKAVGEYGISVASPSIIRKDYERAFIRDNRIKFNKTETAALKKLCDMTRALKRPPRRDEIPLDVHEVIESFSCSYKDLLCHMGLVLHHTPTLPSKLAKKNK